MPTNMSLTGGIGLRHAPCLPPQRMALHSPPTCRGIQSLKRGRVRATQDTENSAATNSSTEQDRIYQGIYGPWKVEQSDLIEVWTYRVAISVLAACCVGESLDVLLLGHQQGILDDNLACWGGIIALGIALYQIHIYVTPLKRMLQVFWGLGTAGFVYLSIFQASSTSVVDFVMEHGWGVWCIGPLFAALTGVTFKEGLCYGKPEAFALTLVIPALLLLHLFGAGSTEGVEMSLDVVACVLLTVFALRKYTQDVVDDIGDGSVFRFQKMSDEEQQAVLLKLKRQESSFL